MINFIYYSVLNINYNLCKNYIKISSVVINNRQSPARFLRLFKICTQLKYNKPTTMYVEAIYIIYL